MNRREKILIVRLGAIGDVILTIPAVASLREHYPEAFIAWLVEEKAAPLLKDHPLLDRVIILPRKRGDRSEDPRGHRDYWSTYKELREIGFDIALDFQGLVKSGLWVRATGAGRRIGFAAASCREPMNIFFSNRRIAPPEKTHVIHKNLHLLEGLGISSEQIRFEFPRNTGAEEYVSAQLEKLGLGSYILVNPCAAWPTKRWSVGKFARLVERIESELGYRCILLWGPGEKAIPEEINQRAGHHGIIAFPTSVPELMELVKRATLLIGGDTASLHMAAAQGVPVVGIYGPTSPWRNGPFHPDDLVAFQELECSHCYRRNCWKMACFQEISADDVFDLVERRLLRLKK